ncbi:hypothetical protein [Piscinibacter sp. XHJ-5]|uniref:hypothetical protein n=1 Tax=Piscinibacter sp. XHJ-5 TaxID=3037797 RepID=UPI0024530FA2|nr:hypothetical protein [Piscinibacter sp. XHJ-5]
MAQMASANATEPIGCEALADQLGDRVAALLHARPGELRMAPLGHVVPRPDACCVLSVTDAAGRPRAVILCAPPEAPDMVQRAMDRARRSKASLPLRASRHILDPLALGRIGALSYAVLPHCRELAAGGLAWRVQRQALSPALFDWLFTVNQATLRPIQDDELEWRFVQPLQRLAALDAVTAAVRDDAQRAAERLQQGGWWPRTVLMHGDLWKGNVLLRPATGLADAVAWRERFIVIDWPGSDSCGYAFFDLVRLAQSMRPRRAALAREFERHCALLECGRDDAAGCLLAALGRMAMQLEHFPMQRFAQMADACHATLRQAF